MLSEDKYFIFDRPKDVNLKYVVKQVLYPIASLWYRFLLLLARPKQTKKKYNVSVCAIFKNEAPYLREWLEFNHIVGVEHFYLYNNDSDDNYIQILQPYIDSGLVTLIDWPGTQQQMPAYHDCIAKFAEETKWLGFIDIDEFIIPKQEDNIFNVLEKFSNYGSVAIYWRLFGSSGYIGRDVKGLVAEDFVVCWPKYLDIGKCFYNTSFAVNINSAKNIFFGHKFWVSVFGIDIPPVNCFGKLTFWEHDLVGNDDFPIQINHYFSKSYKEYCLKKIRGDAFFEINPRDDEYFYRHEMKCTAVDYSAYKYLVKLKLAMNNYDDNDGGNL